MLIETLMSTQMMQQKIAEYFKTQPVVKAWIFGSFARESVEQRKLSTKNSWLFIMELVGMYRQTPVRRIGDREPSKQLATN